MLTGWGCGEATPGPFLSLIRKTEVTAQGPGWNFALDDLAPCAGPPRGQPGSDESGNRPLLVGGSPPPPRTLLPAAAPSQACPQRTRGGGGERAAPS